MKSKYIKEQHCFQEQAGVERPVMPQIEDYPVGHESAFNSDYHHFEGNSAIYKEHIASLRTIPCRPSDIWQEGILYIQGKDYVVCEYSGKNGYHSIEIRELDKPVAPQSEGELWKEVLKKVFGITSFFDKPTDEIFEQEIQELSKDFTLTRKSDVSIKDYEEVIEDHKRIVREIDVIINGDKAAKQASLIDLVGQIKELVDKSDVPEAVEFAEWIKSLFPVLTVENGNWCLESQITSEKLYEAFKTKKP